MQKRQYFGTDGVRAPVGSELMSPAFVLKLGWAIGSVLSETCGKNPMIFIGRDTRISGLMLQSALVSGLLAAGCDVMLLGVLPTPAISFLTCEKKAAAGIVISASHNSFEDNGVKCIDKNGMKFSDDWELAVEQWMQQPMIINSQVKFGCVAEMSDASKIYDLHCRALFPTLSLNGLKLVVDCANGATFDIAPVLLKSFSAKVIAIHDEPNGLNINERCGATHLKSLQKAVLAEQADCGVAFDGDGDRLIMVDHQGDIIDGDQMLGVLALHTDCQAVVGTLMSNLGLEKAMESAGIAFERAAVGDRYVLAALLENNWHLGGEASGHIINLNYSQTGDGILTALQVLKLMVEKQQSLVELKKPIQKRPQILVNVPVEQPKRFMEFDDIQLAVSKAQTQLAGTGRVLLRASGTESCVRVMVECDDEGQANEVAQFLSNMVKQTFAMA